MELTVPVIGDEPGAKKILDYVNRLEDSPDVAELIGLANADMAG